MNEVKRLDRTCTHADFRGNCNSDQKLSRLFLGGHYLVFKNSHISNLEESPAVFLTSRKAEPNTRVHPVADTATYAVATLPHFSVILPKIPSRFLTPRFQRLGFPISPYHVVRDSRKQVGKRRVPKADTDISFVVESIT